MLARDRMVWSLLISVDLDKKGAPQPSHWSSVGRESHSSSHHGSRQQFPLVSLPFSLEEKFSNNLLQGNLDSKFLSKQSRCAAFFKVVLTKNLMGWFFIWFPNKSIFVFTCILKLYILECLGFFFSRKNVFPIFCQKCTHIFFIFKLSAFA